MREEYPQILLILKEIEIENARLHFWATRVSKTHLKILVTYANNLDKIMVHLDGLSSEGVTFLGSKG
jgi:hypothetical protein